MESDFSDQEDTTPGYIDKDFDQGDFEGVSSTNHDFSSSTDWRIKAL